MILEEEIQDKFPPKLFESLVGGTYDFYGVDGDCFCIGVNGTRIVLQAVNDPDDGYRSFLSCFRVREVGKIFFGTPLARVTLTEGGTSTRSYVDCWDENGKRREYTAEQLRKISQDFSGWILKDADTGHVWLTFGTDYGEDYYPCYTFRYTPDEKQTVELENEDD